MKSQATRLTTEEQAYWDHWTAKGYRFKPGEKPPMSTMTPPDLATSHPILDAVLGFLLLFVVFCILGFGLYTVVHATGLVHRG